MTTKKKFRKEKKKRTDKFEKYISKQLNKKLTNKKVLKKEKVVYDVPKYEDKPYRSVFFNGEVVKANEEDAKFISDGEVFFKW